MFSFFPSEESDIYKNNNNFMYAHMYILYVVGGVFIFI